MKITFTPISCPASKATWELHIYIPPSPSPSNSLALEKTWCKHIAPYISALSGVCYCPGRHIGSFGWKEMEDIHRNHSSTNCHPPPFSPLLLGELSVRPNICHLFCHFPTLVNSLDYELGTKAVFCNNHMFCRIFD